MIYIALLLVLIIAAAVVITIATAAARTRLDKNRKDLLDSRRCLNSAEKTLRMIANDTTGNAILEAQIALDIISNYREKELN